MLSSSEVRKRKWGTLAWIGLVGYIFVSDMALEVTGNELMTDSWHRALRHPIGRWGVTLAWLFTTKHLFFRNVLPKLDPFGIIILGARAIQLIGRDNGY